MLEAQAISIQKVGFPSSTKLAVMSVVVDLMAVNGEFVYHIVLLSQNCCIVEFRTSKCTNLDAPFCRHCNDMLQHRDGQLEKLACKVDQGLHADAEGTDSVAWGKNNMVTYPPHDPYLSKKTFSWRFQKNGTYPLRNKIFENNGEN